MKWTKLELLLVKLAAVEVKYLRIPKKVSIYTLKLVLRNRSAEAINKKLKAALNG